MKSSNFNSKLDLTTYDATISFLYKILTQTKNDKQIVKLLNIKQLKVEKQVKIKFYPLEPKEIEKLEFSDPEQNYVKVEIEEPENSDSKVTLIIPEEQAKTAIESKELKLEELDTLTEGISLIASIDEGSISIKFN